MQNITGQVVDVKLASETDHSVLQEEIDHLQSTLDKLSDEVRIVNQYVLLTGVLNVFDALSATNFAAAWINSLLSSRR